jgi:hypothetical protein
MHVGRGYLALTTDELPYIDRMVAARSHQMARCEPVPARPTSLPGHVGTSEGKFQFCTRQLTAHITTHVHIVNAAPTFFLALLGCPNTWVL